MPVSKPPRKPTSPVVTKVPNKKAGLAEFAADGQVQSSVVVSLVSIGSKIFEYVEHGDFLMSLNDEKFRLFLNIWNGGGWAIALVLAIIYACFHIYQVREKGKITDNTSSHWDLVLALMFAAFMGGALWAATASGGVPNVIINHDTGGQCFATIDTTRILSFRDKYKIALVCYLSNSTQDPLSDKNIAVSNLFTIAPGGVSLQGLPGPAATPQPAPVPPLLNPLQSKAPSAAAEPPAPAAAQAPQIVMIQMNYVAVLVPNEVSREKVTTLSDLIALGGKVIDARYYK